MMKLLFLISILFFLIFLLINKIKFFKGFSKLYLIILLIVMTALFLLSKRIINDKSSEGKYFPAEYDGKVLSPGKVEFEKK